MVMGQNPATLSTHRYPNIDGDWMVIPLNIVIVGVDPSPNSDFIWSWKMAPHAAPQLHSLFGVYESRVDIAYA